MGVSQHVGVPLKRSIGVLSCLYRDLWGLGFPKIVGTCFCYVGEGYNNDHSILGSMWGSCV